MRYNRLMALSQRPGIYLLVRGHRQRYMSKHKQTPHENIADTEAPALATGAATAVGRPQPTASAANGSVMAEAAAAQTADAPVRVPGVYGREAIAQNRLEPWPNPRPTRDYVIHFELPEFTCLCPRSGFPDFAIIVIDYVPDASVVELKSLKLYINGYRDRAISHEGATNDILDDLLATLAPRWMRVVAEFNARGNVKTVVIAEHAAPGYAGPRPTYQRPTYTGI